MRYRSLITTVLSGIALIPRFVAAQGYTVVPLSIENSVAPTYMSGELPQFIKGYSKKDQVTYGYIDENGAIGSLPFALFRRESPNNPPQALWLDLIVDPSTVIMFSEKRNATVLASVKDGKLSIKRIRKGHQMRPIAVNSQGQALFEETIPPTPGSSSPLHEHHFRYFDGSKLHSVYRAKIATSKNNPSDLETYLDHGFIDDSSRWFLSGRLQSDTSSVAFSGFGDGANAQISEKAGAPGESVKDFSWIMAAGRGLVLSTDDSQNISLTSTDGRLLAATQGYTYGVISSDGDAFLNYKGTWGISLNRLTTGGLAAISCPSLGDGINLLHTYRNGNLLVSKLQKSGQNKVYLLKKGGSDCNRRNP